MNKKPSRIWLILLLLLQIFLSGCANDSLSVDTEITNSLTDNSNEKVYKMYAGSYNLFFECLYWDVIDLDILRNDDHALYLAGKARWRVCCGHFYVAADRDANQTKLILDSDFKNNDNIMSLLENSFSDHSFMLKYAENPEILFTPNVYVKETFIFHGRGGASFIYYRTNIGDYVLLFNDLEFNEDNLPADYIGKHIVSDYTLYLIPVEKYCEYVHFEVLGQIEGARRYPEIDLDDYKFTKRIGIAGLIKREILILLIAASTTLITFVVTRIRNSRCGKVDANE
ncbi:MAG: hypothetical protein IKZ05_04550 [Clostridia bacterium]|nr:hypothetical protein [Clostridia bacterium]